MSLTEIVGRLIIENSGEAEKKSNALKNAERLADIFADIRPQPNNIPLEKYFGTPTFENDRMFNHLGMKEGG